MGWPSAKRDADRERRRETATIRSGIPSVEGVWEVICREGGRRKGSIRIAICRAAGLSDRNEGPVNEGEKRLFSLSLSGLSRLACRQLAAYAHVTGRLADRDHRGVFYRPHLGHPLTT